MDIFNTARVLGILNRKFLIKPGFKFRYLKSKSILISYYEQQIQKLLHIFSFNIHKYSVCVTTTC